MNIDDITTLHQYIKVSENFQFLFSLFIVYSEFGSVSLGVTYECMGMKWILELR